MPTPDDPSPLPPETRHDPLPLDPLDTDDSRRRTFIAALTAKVPKVLSAYDRALDLQDSDNVQGVLGAAQVADRLADRLYGRPTEHVEVTGEARLIFERVAPGVSTRAERVIEIGGEAEPEVEEEKERGVEEGGRGGE